MAGRRPRAKRLRIAVEDIIVNRVERFHRRLDRLDKAGDCLSRAHPLAQRGALLAAIYDKVTRGIAERGGKIRERMPLKFISQSELVDCVRHGEGARLERLVAATVGHAELTHDLGRRVILRDGAGGAIGFLDQRLDLVPGRSLRLRRQLEIGALLNDFLAAEPSNGCAQLGQRFRVFRIDLRRRRVSEMIIHK